MTNAPFELDYLRELIKLMEETDLAEVEVGEEERRVRLCRRQPAPAPTYVTNGPAGAPMPAGEAVAPAAAASTPAVKTFNAPMVGTFYLASSPDVDPFVQPGQTVKAGKVVCIIEAMKTFNQIEIDQAGSIKKILVEDGQPVEFGQPLFEMA
jgi:acetyl-CoA carboxylase biotin carboxyl carrier protein